MDQQSLFLLLQQQKKKKKKREDINHLRYSFEILDNLWKERSKCTAGIKQNASEKSYFSWRPFAFSDYWRNTLRNKNLMKVMTHLPWEVPFQKINVLEKRRKFMLWSILWETRLMKCLNHFLIIWFFLMFLKKFANLCDNRGIMSTHTFHSAFVINKLSDIGCFWLYSNNYLQTLRKNCHSDLKCLSFISTKFYEQSLICLIICHLFKLWSNGQIYDQNRSLK